ncbi:MAG: NADH-quinone oxidoreductase subunit I [Pedosphaera sp.]|nr:NADH-quinone oxidoreductase subunit I [Pedosphaera sp.]
MAKVVERAKLRWFERLYLPAIWSGVKVTARHFLSWKRSEVYSKEQAGFELKATMQYPEERWTVPAGYRGAPYLVSDQDGHTKCVSCQLCEFVCPPKAIKIIPPGPTGTTADRPNAEKMPAEFEINMLRCIFCGLCQEVCPEEAIFLQKDYSLTSQSREEMIYNKEKLLALGGTHGGIQKWKHKLDEAQQQETFPVKD